MHLKTRNVNTAFKEFVSIFTEGEYKHRSAWKEGEYPDNYNLFQAPIRTAPSRNGRVTMIDEPVTVTYSNPRERVLVNSGRDANPFFHLYESLFMLAGRNDVAPLAYYAKQMAEYSDDGKTLNGAYGYRWRKSPDHDYTMVGTHDNCDTIDQLDLLVAHLKADPNSRRAVLQMWNVEDDLLKIDYEVCKVCCGQGIPPGQSANIRTATACPGCGGGGASRKASKDVCCNLSVMFSLRKDGPTAEDGISCAACITRNKMCFFVDPGPCPTCGGRYGAVSKAQTFLDMTVTNRSNDLIWGMLGGDYVHFSMLQEYMAARLGAEVGVYNHFSNNLHAYDWNFKPETYSPEVYDYDGVKTVPLVKDPTTFERELPRFVGYWTGGDEAPAFPSQVAWEEPFLDSVARPLLAAFRAHKLRDNVSASKYLDEVAADDWRQAGINWIKKRRKV